MSSGLYNSARQAFLQGTIDWEDDDVDALLVNDTYAFVGTHQYVSNIATFECTATDYARQNVATRTVSDETITVADCDDITFAGLGGATDQDIAGIVFFKNTTEELICYVDTTDFETPDMDVVFTIPTAGVFTFYQASTTNGAYDSARQAFLQGTIDWEDDDIDALITNATYSWGRTEQYVSNIATFECTATDYARINVTGRTVSDATTTVADCDDLTFPGLGGASEQEIGGVVFFKNTSEELICYIDTVDFTTQDYDATFTVPGTGVFTWAG